MKEEDEPRKIGKGAVLMKTVSEHTHKAITKTVHDGKGNAITTSSIMNTPKTLKKRKALKTESESDGAGPGPHYDKVSSSPKNTTTAASTADTTPKKKLMKQNNNSEPSGPSSECVSSPFDCKETTTKTKPPLLPQDSAAAAAKKAKREYHRHNAARSRQRNREMMDGLVQQVTKLNGRAAGLQSDNNALRARIDLLQKQNQELASSREVQEHGVAAAVPLNQVPVAAAVAAPSDNSQLAQLLALLQTQHAQQQQGQQQQAHQDQQARLLQQQLQLQLQQQAQQQQQTNFGNLNESQVLLALLQGGTAQQQLPSSLALTTTTSATTATAPTNTAPVGGAPQQQQPWASSLTDALRGAMVQPGQQQWQWQQLQQLGQHQLGQHQQGQHQQGRHQLGQHQLGQYQLGQHQLGQHQQGQHQHQQAKPQQDQQQANRTDQAAMLGAVLPSQTLYSMARQVQVGLDAVQQQQEQQGNDVTGNKLF
jgi:hypothetical protein